MGKRLVADDSASEHMLAVTDNESASGVGRSSHNGSPSTPINVSERLWDETRLEFRWGLQEDLIAVMLFVRYLWNEWMNG